MTLTYFATQQDFRNWLEKMNKLGLMLPSGLAAFEKRYEKKSSHILSKNCHLLGNECEPGKDA